MRRLITLLLAVAAAIAAARAIARKRGSGTDENLGPSVMPRPTQPSREEPMEDKAETPGPIEEGESGAITAAPVPEEPIAGPERETDDAELERAVETEIAEDPAVEADEVQVEVEGGVAQLSGTVPDEQTALRV